jgi:hypothetical protein
LCAPPASRFATSRRSGAVKRHRTRGTGPISQPQPSGRSRPGRVPPRRVVGSAGNRHDSC